MSLGGVDEVELLGSNHAHDDIENTELSSGKSTDHDPSGDESDSAESVESFFGSDVSESRDHGSFTTSSLLVDLGEEGISGVRDGGGDDTSNNTRLERDDDVLSLGAGFGAASLHAVDHFGGFTLDGKLGHGVRNLLAEEGDKSRVESVDDSHFRNESFGGSSH